MSKIEVAKYMISNEKIPKEFDNYTIVQISDLHNKSFGKNNIKLINEIDTQIKNHPRLKDTSSLKKRKKHIL